MVTRSSRSARPVLYAHRGAAAIEPENTLASFQRALELGADALEMDLHLSSDGHVVVSHDPMAMRMTGVNAALRTAPLVDIRSWDAGWGLCDASGDRPFAGKGYRIPTLEEVLVELPGVPINVDIKQPRPPMVEPVLALIQRLGASERVTLASFQTRTMLAARRRGYPGRTGLTPIEVLSLMGTPGPLWQRLWRRLGGVGTAAQVPARSGPIRFDTRAFIARCHLQGISVDFWTINDPAEAHRLLALGADGIMTDDPAVMKPVFDALYGQQGPSSASVR